MKIVENNELVNINGGFTYNSTFINAMYKVISFLFEVGKQLGSTLNRTINGNTCGR